MTVTVVSMPEVTVTRTDFAGARERLAADSLLLVDVELPPDAASVPLAARLGLDAEELDWFGRTGEPARADFLGDRAGFVVPVVQGDAIRHVHVVVTERFLATAHHGQGDLARKIAQGLRHERPVDPVHMLFIVLQEALATFRLSAVRNLLETEELEDEMFEDRRAEQLQALARLRRRSAQLHHALLPFLQVTDAVLTRRMINPSFPEERQRSAREFQTAGRLVLADIESLQEATRRSFASYSSLVAGEQNGVINRLAIVSVIFLPLSFLTGFFGMNFTFLTDKLETRDDFWLLAIGLQALVLLGSFYVLHRTRIWRRLLDED
ncbi:CorA family divalent cation transporter [Streptomyces griseoluteus]|uniref:CorA family divalent cation transporter n=1 Tax=Streptomyces TaxID=1883 RepID=UPI001FC93E88|nr:CorA family divalent cation transporter [Streptomyces recifensis]